MTYESVIEEQFFLARKANISLLESSMMPEFEREAFVNLLIKDLRKEAESYNVDNLP